MSSHKRFLALALVASSLMSASGCVCVSTASRAGNVTFLWAFSGRPCALVPDITNVTIQIPGQVLQNGGTYGCLNGNPSTAGIVLLDFRPGTYSFSIQGNNRSGQTLYEAAGKFTVSGDVTVSVDLKPGANAPGAAIVTWTLPNNANCANAVGEAISTVDIVIDSTTTLHQSCNAGIVAAGGSGPGVTVTGLLAGTHTMELRAFGASNFQYFAVINSITITAGGTVEGQFTLGYVVGSLPIKWQFLASGVAVTCEQIGSPMVFVNLKDSRGNFVYSGAGYSVPCKNGDGLQGTLFPYLYGDTYQVYVQANPNNVLYRSNQNTPPRATVTAGVFPLLDANTFAVNVTNP